MITSFRVSLGGVDQNYMPPGVAVPYVPILWSHIEEDDTCGFDVTTGKWTAPCDGKVTMNWQVWNQAGACNNQANFPLFVSKLLINGNSNCAPIGPIGSDPNTSAQGGGVTVSCKAGDVFSIINCCTPQSLSAPVVINGRFEHTWWSGLFAPKGT